MDKVRLYGWTEKLESPVLSGTFGELVRLASVVNHYRGDLFHDAMWISKHVTGPTVFYFGADDWGTAIGTDRDLVTMMRRNVWRVEITEEGHVWYVSIEAEILLDA